VGLLLAAAVGPLTAANLPVKRFALFIGANRGGAGVQPLLYAQKDALKMQQVMQEVGGVTVADRILLLDPTPAEVRDALAALAVRIGTPGPSRRTEFLLYYSGHSDEEGLLLGDESLGYKDLRDGLQAVPADVRIAILDSCSSGAFARLKGGVQRAPFLGQDSSQMKGHAFLTSSSENEASQESDTLQGSFFTHYLVSGLRGGADRVGDGLITLDEAYAYAFQNTLARTESTRAGPQHPSYEIQLSGTGNLILADVKTTNARLEVGPAVAGKLYVRNQEGQLFAEVAKDAGSPLSLAVPAGTYTVTAVTPQKSLSAKVVLTAKGPTSVDADDFQEQDLARFATRGPAADTPEPEATDLGQTLSSLGADLVPAALPEVGWGLKTHAFSVGLLVDYTGDLHGLQASGLIAIGGQDLWGLQLAGLGSISRGTLRGIQYGGLFSIAAGGVQGLQNAGLFNISGGESGGFWQGAGVFNLAAGTFTGLQSAGVFNVAENLRGIQAAPVNVAGEVKGLQVGVVNINSHIEGAGLGLIFISPDAYYHPKLLFDDRGLTHVNFQWGMGGLYWVVGVAGDSKDSQETKAWEGSVGAGWRLTGGFFTWDNDLGWQSRNTAGVNDSNSGYLRSTLGLRSSWFGLEAGVELVPNAGAQPLSVGPFDLKFSPTWFWGVRLL